MLGAEAAAELTHDVMDDTLDRRRAGEECVARCARCLVQIEVQIAVADVSVRHQASIRNVLLHPLRGPLDELRQRGHRHGNVVFQAAAVEALCFGNGLAHLPHGVAFAFAAGERGIQNQAFLECPAEGFLQDDLERIRRAG